MKKNILYIILSIIIIIGGYWLMSENKEKKLVENAQSEAELFIKKNFEDINEVSINKDKYKFYPVDLGGLSITGFVNGNKNLYFNVNFDTTDNQIGKVTSFVKPKEFPTLKEECKNNFCQ